MTILELENLVRDALGLDPAAEISPHEEWDSLDHFLVISKIQSEEANLAGNLDLSKATNFSKLSDVFFGG